MADDIISDYLTAKPRVSAKPVIDTMLNRWYLDFKNNAKTDTQEIASIGGFTHQPSKTVYEPVCVLLTDLVYALLEQARFTPEVDKMLGFMQIESPIDYFWRRMDMFGFVVVSFVHGVSLKPFPTNHNPVTYAEVAVMIGYLDAHALASRSYTYQRFGSTAKHLQDSNIQKQLNEMVSIATDQLRQHARLLAAKQEGEKERGERD